MENSKANYKTEYIKEYQVKHNLNKKQFCDKCKISTYMYSKIMAKCKNIRIDILFNICNTINLSSDVFLEIK